VPPRDNSVAHRVYQSCNFRSCNFITFHHFRFIARRNVADATFSDAFPFIFLFPFPFLFFFLVGSRPAGTVMTELPVPVDKAVLHLQRITENWKPTHARAKGCAVALICSRSCETIIVIARIIAINIRTKFSTGSAICNTRRDEREFSRRRVRARNSISDLLLISQRRIRRSSSLGRTSNPINSA